MIRNDIRKNYTSSLFIGFIITSVFAILFGKILYTNSDLLPLYIYGLAVTAMMLLVFCVALLLYVDPYTKVKKFSSERRKEIKVACLVAVHNEKKLIIQCVNSLIAQTYRNKEIIIVDDASTDGTADTLRPYMEKKLITLISLTDNVGKKKALATGMLHSRAGVFVFSDSDSVIASDAVEKAVAILHSQPDIGAISGYVRPINADKNIFTKIQDTWYDGQFSIRKAAESYFGAVTCVSGPLAIFRREAIYNYIPAWQDDHFLGQEFRFATDRTLTGYVLGSMSVGHSLQEKYADSAFMKKVYPPHEWRVVYSEVCRAETQVPETFIQMLNQQIRWKKSFIRNTFFTGKFFWKKNPVVALIYYSHVVFVVVGPLIAFRHLVYLPLTGNIFSAILYIAGIFYMGCMFGVVYRMKDTSHSYRWLYRPLMSFMSVLVFSWLVFYSVVTIKKMVWIRNS